MNHNCAQCRVTGSLTLLNKKWQIILNLARWGAKAQKKEVEENI